MLFRIKNLGVLKEIDLDLSKNLTVLCGSNNTGKTYIAYFIYGLIRKRFFVRSHCLRNSSFIKEKVSILIKDKYLEINLLDKCFTDELNKILNEMAQQYIENELAGVFGVGGKEAEWFKKTELTINFDCHKDNFEKEVNKHNVKSAFSIHGSQLIDVEKTKDSPKLKIKLLASEAISKDILGRFIADIIGDILTDIIFKNAYIAPAERIAINIFSKELSVKRNVLVDKMLELAQDNNEGEDPFDLIKRRATRYPQPIRDGLEISEDLANFKKTDSKFVYLAKELEENILQGKVNLTKEGDVQFISDKAKSKKLPIHLTASVIKSLASLVIYFRHLAKKGDFIIIDEPEQNLHPDNQVLIARLLARIANEGFKLIVSTHSDYIIRELNNLIMLSQQDSEEQTRLKQEYGYHDNEIISPSQINAYLFKFPKVSSRQSISEKLEVTEYGFEVETIDNEINNLNQRSQELYFNLSDKE